MVERQFWRFCPDFGPCPTELPHAIGRPLAVSFDAGRSDLGFLKKHVTRVGTFCARVGACVGSASIVIKQGKKQAKQGCRTSLRPLSRDNQLGRSTIYGAQSQSLHRQPAW